MLKDRARVQWLTTLGAFVVLAGCSESDRTTLQGASGEEGSDRSNLPTYTDTAVVGASGAVISAGGAEIVIPRGALAEPVEIVIQTSEDGFTAFPSSEAEQVLAFLPHGTQFLIPVTIQIPHDHELVDSLSLFTSEPGQDWALVSGSRFTEDYATAEVMHFSYFFASEVALEEVLVGNGGNGGAGGTDIAGGSGGSSGATNAGAGGSGGGAVAGGVDYRDDGEWRGHLYATATGANSTILRTGMCAEGVVAADPSYQSNAVLGWNLNQDEGSELTGRWNPTTDAIYYDVTESAAELRLNIYDGSGQTWCVQISDGSGFALLTDFNTTCWDGAGDFYNGVTPLQGVQVLVPGNDVQERPFNFCINELSAMNATGNGGGGGNGGAAGGSGSGGNSGSAGGGSLDYLIDGEWRGPLYSEVSDPSSTIERSGMCAEGIVAPDPASQSFAFWGWNIYQVGTTVGSWYPTTDAIYYDVTASAAELRLNIYDGNGQTWCVQISDGSGFALLTDFNTTCWDGQGDSYDGVSPLRGVQVLVPGENVQERPFDFCINELSARSTGNGGGGADAGAGAGGADNSGDPDAGSPVGGSGGNPGSAGGGSLDYLIDGEWRGPLYSEVSDPSSTIERSGMCAEGSVAPDPSFESFAFWGWNIMQVGTTVGSWTPTTDAIYYDVTASAEELRLNIYDGNGQTWCVEISDGSGFALLTDFNTTCWNSTGDSYDGVTPLRGVQVLVPGDNVEERPFDFCINELSARSTDNGGGGADAGAGGGGNSGDPDAGSPVGGSGGSVGSPDGGGSLDYLIDGEWRGPLYSEVSDPSSTIERSGMCAEGIVAPDPTLDSFAFWGWNISQVGTTVGSWTPTTDGIYYDVTASAAELRLNIYDGNGQTWCVQISDGSGFALLTDFNTTCWDGEGDFYDGVSPLRGVQVLVPGDNVQERPFDFCINELSAMDES